MAPWIWFLIAGGLFFLMMRGGCGAHVMGHGHGGHQHDHRKSGADGGEPLAASEEQQADKRPETSHAH